MIVWATPLLPLLLSPPPPKKSTHAKDANDGERDDLKPMPRVIKLHIELDKVAWWCVSVSADARVEGQIRRQWDIRYECTGRKGAHTNTFANTHTFAHT